MNSLPSTIQKIKDQIVANYQPEKIILFGSYAWGEPGPNSDFDFCVIKPGVEEKSHYERTLELTRVINYTKASDFVIYTPYEIKKRLWLEDPFIKKIVNEGKIIYGG